MKKYMTPDFDVTVYEIKETITADDMDGGNMTSIWTPDGSDEGWNGDINFG